MMMPPVPLSDVVPIVLFVSKLTPSSSTVWYQRVMAVFLLKAQCLLAYHLLIPVNLSCRMYPDKAHMPGSRIKMPDIAVYWQKAAGR